MSKIREVTVLTCASLFWAVHTIPGVLSLFLESTFSEESRKIGRSIVTEDEAHEGSESQVSKGAVKGTEDILPGKKILQ